jgi:flagellar biogenesis protein FliO
MQTALGLIGFVAYIAAVIALAAAVTWLVVRLTPAKKPKTETPTEA